MTMEKVRWGIAGPGRIAHKFAVAIKNVECAELVAVASRFEEEASQFAKEFNVPNIFVGYEDMAAFDGVDAIYVSTPPHVHKDVAMIYLQAKKHVLCEKSISINAFQATELEDCASKNNVFLMEAMWMKFLPAIKEAKSIVDSGVLGEIQNVRADFSALIPGERNGRNVFMKEFGGGALLDLGIYAMNFANLIMCDVPESISSEAKLWNGVDVNTGILMKYPSGAIASVECSLEVFKPRSAYVYGTKGYMHIPDFYGAQKLYLKIGDEDEKHISLPRQGGGFEEEICEASACIMSGKRQSDIHPMSDSIKVLKQMDAIRKQIGVKYPLEGEEWM